MLPVRCDGWLLEEQRAQPAELRRVAAYLRANGPHNGDAEGVIAAADAALYEAKREGRDRLVLAGAAGRTG